MLIDLFLKKNEIRLILILANLSYDKAISKTSLCNILKVNQASLNRDLFTLNTFFSTNKNNYHLPTLTIVDNHILLEKQEHIINKNTLITLLLKSLLTDSYIFQIIDLVVRKKNVSALEVADTISISLSYLNQSLTSLNKFLSPYKIRIRNKQNRLEMQGSLENIFFFSYLFIDMSNKLFEEKKETLTIDQQKLAARLTQPDLLHDDSKEWEQLITFSHLIELYTPELNKLYLGNTEVISAITAHTAQVSYFNEHAFKSIYNKSACDFLNFLANILYVPINHQQFHLQPFEKMKSEKQPFIHETLKISDFLLTYVPFISRKEKDLLEYATYLYSLYLSVFEVNIYELFDPTIFIQQSTIASQQKFPTIRLPEKPNKINDMPGKLNEESLLYPIYVKHSLVFSEMVTYLHRKELRGSLTIALFFPDNPAFQYYLKKRLSQIFQTDTFILTQVISQADIVVSDQFHFNNTSQHFYYFPDSKSETLLIDLCQLISKTYLTNIYQKGHERITLLNYSTF